MSVHSRLCDCAASLHHDGTGVETRSTHAVRRVRARPSRIMPQPFVENPHGAPSRHPNAAKPNTAGYQLIEKIQ
ncbi:MULTISPECIES: hypothetical protein [unclassified Burkholderia]|uniref:hypothetical protein n=1 Tax=unclassified Burkholderia TaxID=2613784 RepID=UPI000F575987|nr:MULTISPECIES: hypothetical protein [unclassified Burkholderia]